MFNTAVPTGSRSAKSVRLTWRLTPAPLTPTRPRVSTASANATEPVWVGRDVTAVRVTIVSGSAYDVSLEAVTSSDPSAPSGSAGALGVSVPGGPDRFGFAVALVLAGLILGAVRGGMVSVAIAPQRGACPRARDGRARRLRARSASAAAAAPACTHYRAADTAGDDDAQRLGCRPTLECGSRVRVRARVLRVS